MGWLFGQKKKEPRVPFPAGKPFEETALQLPSTLSKGKVIELEEIKAAAGLEESPFFPEEEREGLEIPGKMPVPLSPFSVPKEGKSPLYIKVDAYQRLLGELDDLKSRLGEMKAIHSRLETSEYNEENNFVKLKRSVRSMHDHMLLTDKIIFKTQGE